MINFCRDRKGSGYEGPFAAPAWGVPAEGRLPGLAQDPSTQVGQTVGPQPA